MQDANHNKADAKDYLNLGNIFKSEGNWEVAIEKYNAALQLKPNFAPALNQLAAIYEGQNNFEQALQYRQRAAQLQPDNATVQARLAKTKMKLRDTQKNSHLRGNNSMQETSQILEKYPENINDLMKSRPERINFLSQINQSNFYLEIGVNKGVTFNQIKIKNKVAVDPRFRFKYIDYACEHIRFYEITSDEFFRTSSNEVFDFIYLDGLHIFEQTFRDFCATLAMSNEKTIWLIDDTVPSDMFAADRSLERGVRLRQATGGKGGAWMGDVFKTIYAIHDFFPQFSYATFPGHGQTVVWRETRKDFQPRWNSLSEITALTYLDFLETKEEIINISTPQEIITCLKQSFDFK